ncbi:MAG TPA: hypothetical protein DHV98_01440 [Flavobacteriaceae bacterium]|mgnify:CR=1 FL=1|jgi:hypothetical protein|nr:hypothetical protein [Flavobacteriaceae bacterium]
MNKKQALIQAVKILGFGLILLIISTYVLNFAFLNKNIIPLYLMLPLGIIGVAATIYTLFRGIRTLVSVFFDQ